MTGVRAVSFDLGQTLVSLDPGMLAGRLAEVGMVGSEAAIEAALPVAFAASDAAVRAGLGNHPWKIFMGRLLSEAGVPGERVAAVVDWLWDEQPRRNLWRRPVPGMLALAHDLIAARVPIAVFTNSEGRAAELVEEIGWSSTFPLLGDSGRLGIEKPDPAAFAWIAEQLGVPPASVVHVGDSVSADVLGALAFGMRAIWFSVPEAGSHQVPEALPPGVPVARSAAELRRELAALGLPIAAQ